jgi:hypothetical protein
MNPLAADAQVNRCHLVTTACARNDIFPVELGEYRQITGGIGVFTEDLFPRRDWDFHRLAFSGCVFRVGLSPFCLGIVSPRFVGGFR